jgi:omega-amidase
MQDLNIHYIQSELAWQDPEENQARFTEQIRAIKGADLIVLPEMFLTGFIMAPELCAESDSSPRFSWLLALAKEQQVAITGSVCVKVGDEFLNRLVFVTPEGRIARYDKRHLFRMGDEPNHYSAGDQRTLIHWRGWRILPIICYDLRFPVWCRNRGDYDLMLCVANWPAVRSDAWSALLKARAIENQAYVLGVNRVGVDGNGLEYSGDSEVFDFKGASISKLTPHQAGQASVVCSQEDLNSFRASFPAWADTDHFSISEMTNRVVEL